MQITLPTEKNGRRVCIPMHPDLGVSAQEHGSDVPVIEIFCHILCNHRFVGFEQVEVALPDLRGDLKADMQQLAQAAVVRGGSAHMAQGGGVLLGGPTTDDTG